MITLLKIENSTESKFLGNPGYLVVISENALLRLSASIFNNTLAEGEELILAEDCSLMSQTDAIIPSTVLYSNEENVYNYEEDKDFKTLTIFSLDLKSNLSKPVSVIEALLISALDKLTADPKLAVETLITIIKAYFIGNAYIAEDEELFSKLYYEYDFKRSNCTASYQDCGEVYNLIQCFLSKEDLG